MKRDPRDSAQRPKARELQDEPRPPALELEFRAGDFPEVRFDPEEFQALLEARGVGCLYRRAIRCPCLRIESRSPKVGCLACGGLGYCYPVEMEEPIVAIVQNRHPRRQQLEVGQQVTGTVSVTFPQGLIPGQGDMLCPDGDEHVVQQVLRRSVAQVDPATVRSRQTHPDQRPPIVSPVTERLLYPDVIAVDHLYWLDTETEDLRLGQMGRDYTLNGNRLEFFDGQGPPPGRGFSVRYRAPAVYMVSPGEPIARTGEVGFPFKCEAQRLDRWGTPDLR